MLTNLTTKAITLEMDVALVRQLVKEQTTKLRMSLIDQTKLITAASEIARNTLIYGGGGQFSLLSIEKNTRRGLQLIFEDHGPGIENIDQALQDGFTTGKGMGLGLSGSKRLVDEFHLESTPGKGTRIILIKWLH